MHDTSVLFPGFIALQATANGENGEEDTGTKKCVAREAERSRILCLCWKRVGTRALINTYRRKMGVRFVGERRFSTLWEIELIYNGVEFRYAN